MSTVVILMLLNKLMLIKNKMCLTGQESNNVGLGFNEDLKYWHNLLGRVLEAKNKKWSFLAEDYYAVNISLENIWSKFVSIDWHKQSNLS